MFTERTLRKIVSEFIGDDEQSLYKYKSGPELVSFVNSFFDENDEYGQGFPSRWSYIYDYVEPLQIDNMQEFFQYILSERYLRVEEEIPRKNLFQFIEQAVDKFNTILDLEDYQLKRISGNLILVNLDNDLEKIGEGGFAEVFISKSSGYAVKKLKSNLRYDKNIRHRFKREYEMTEELNDIPGVIPVFDFDHDNYTYTMLRCTHNLEQIVSKKKISDTEKDDIITFILDVMTQVHQRDHIHRDLSPSNVLYNEEKFFISDFGLGKVLGKEYSHRTTTTMGMGQLYYTAPEQLQKLANSGKYSDVYSIGKIINMIKTGDSENFDHEYQYLCRKATARNGTARYQDAEKFKEAFLTFLKRKGDKSFLQKVHKQIEKKDYTNDVGIFIQGLTSEELAENFLNVFGFEDALFFYIQNNIDSTYSFLQSLNENKSSVVSRFEDADAFGRLGYRILNDDSRVYPYESKEEAARLLHWAAWSANRFNMQDKIDELIDSGIDPTIEELLEK